VTETAIELTRKNRLWFNGLSLAFFAGIVVATTFFGDKANTLHTTGQQWAFFGMFAVLGINVAAEYFVPKVSGTKP
jgi:hypothetical protein